MSRPYIPKVVTANALLEGDVVYLTADDRWSRQHHEAELIEDEAHAQMRLLHAASQKSVIVGAYLADARRGPDGPEPTHFRDAFRTRGPSNYFHGKQEEVAQ
ncbi:MAG: DUF2849 domain-containing protein [Cereibacter changlensis]